MCDRVEDDALLAYFRSFVESAEPVAPGAFGSYLKKLKYPADFESLFQAGLESPSRLCSLMRHYATSEKTALAPDLRSACQTVLLTQLVTTTPELGLRTTVWVFTSSTDVAQNFVRALC